MYVPVFAFAFANGAIQILYYCCRLWVDADSSGHCCQSANCRLVLAARYSIGRFLDNRFVLL